MGTPSKYAKYANLRSSIGGANAAVTAGGPRASVYSRPFRVQSEPAQVLEAERTTPPAPVAQTAQPGAADSIFYGKGKASAAGFRPSYWSYDRPAPSEPPHSAVPPIAAEEAPQVALAAAAEEPPAVIGAPAQVYAPAAQEAIDEAEMPAAIMAPEAVGEAQIPAAASAPEAAEADYEPEMPAPVADPETSEAAYALEAPEAVAEPEAAAPEASAIAAAETETSPAPSGARDVARERAAVADELAVTIEHVMSSRYAGGRAAAVAETPLRRAAPSFTGDSLMAELSQARQARPERPRRAPTQAGVRPTKPSMSLLDRAFVFAGLVLVLGALLLFSPWRDQFLPLDRLAHLFN